MSGRRLWACAPAGEGREPEGEAERVDERVNAAHFRLVAVFPLREESHERDTALRSHG